MVPSSQTLEFWFRAIKGSGKGRLQLPASGMSSKVRPRTDVPDNAFIFDPDSYWVFDGKLKIAPGSEFRPDKYVGYFFGLLGVILLIFGILNLSNGWGVLYPLGGSIFFGVLAFVQIKVNGGNEQYNNDGRITTGQLISVEGRPREVEQNGKYVIFFQITARYSFYGPDHDTQIIGTTTCVRDDLQDRELPEPGTPVVVLYINPKRYKVC